MSKNNLPLKYYTKYFDFKTYNKITTGSHILMLPAVEYNIIL